jgi:hypothetical protein
MYVISLKYNILKVNKNSDKMDVRKMKGESVPHNDDIGLICNKIYLEKSVLVMRINRKFILIESNPFSHTLKMVNY